MTRILITGSNSGILNTFISFTGTENLSGGGALDVFVIADGAGIDGTLDAGELGAGSTIWVKLILGGTTQQVVQPDVETGKVQPFNLLLLLARGYR